MREHRDLRRRISTAAAALAVESDGLKQKFGGIEGLLTTMLYDGTPSMEDHGLRVHGQCRVSDDTAPLNSGFIGFWSPAFGSVQR